jgi:hypothetical protein
MAGIKISDGTMELNKPPITAMATGYMHFRASQWDADGVDLPIMPDKVLHASPLVLR